MILIGIKSVSASGSYHGAEGFEGFNITASNVTVIASGTKEELKKMIEDARKVKDVLNKELNDLEDKLNSFQLCESEDYDVERDKILKKYKKARLIFHSNFDNLLIIEGEII